jgi:hypothetical protein
MDDASYALPLHRLSRGQAAPDPADLGTAFGLDMSMQPGPDASFEDTVPSWLERLGLNPDP